MTARNDITGDSIATKAASDAYRNNYERIFGKKQEPRIEITEDIMRGAQEFRLDPERLVQYLRDSGLTQALSVIAYSRITNMMPIEAKNIVHYSKTWADQNSVVPKYPHNDEPEGSIPD